MGGWEIVPDFSLVEDAVQVEREGGAGVGVGGEEGGAHHQQAAAFGYGGVDEAGQCTHWLITEVGRRRRRKEEDDAQAGRVLLAVVRVCGGLLGLGPTHRHFLPVCICVGGGGERAWVWAWGWVGEGQVDARG